MLPNLMVGAQYCSSTHCEFHELQLEPSAFHAVHTYAAADAEAGAAGAEAGGEKTPVSEPCLHASPPPISALFSTNMFGLGAPALNGGGGVGGVDSLTETNDTIGAETREAQKPAAREAGDGHDESHKLLMAGPIEMA